MTGPQYFPEDKERKAGETARPFPRTASTRRHFLRTALAGATAPLAASFPASAEAAGLPVGGETQLFLDDSLLDAELTHGVTRTLNPPRQIERVLKPTRPSEALGFIFYGSVIDGPTAKLFYGSYDAEKGKHFALASSEDGLQWERPELGLVEYRGNKQNNLLPVDAVEASVFLDPKAPPGKRYRLIYSRYWPDPKKAGVYLASSPDGVHWTTSETRLLPFVPDSQHCAVWDESLEKYVIYTRAWNPDRVIVRAAVDDIEEPWPHDTSVEPHHIWGPDKVPTLTRELPTVMACDDGDPDGVQLYTNAVTRYRGHYLAFPAAYQTFNGPDWKHRALNGNDGTFDVQFASSRDGIHWTRWRTPYLAAGLQDGLDLRLVSMAQGIVQRGDELHQYFIGWPHTHGRPVVWDKDLEDREAWLQRDLGGIYRATQRIDGYVSMNAGDGGALTTRPLTVSGGSLGINFHTFGSGGIRITLLDEAGAPLPGYSGKESHWVNADAVNHTWQWSQGADLSRLSNRPVRIRFEMRNARLFSFRFSDLPL